MARSKHCNSIPFVSELLGTVGTKGELFISDVNNVDSPFRMGNAIARADDFDCLDWNKKTSHIMVTGSSGGIITVWDIKNKKESLTLNNLGRRPVSAVAWDPVKTTRLITANPSDTDPHILVWDLRNANAPERVLRGHDGGVLSLSWCSQDNNLLLSCGKDNRTLCWNPQSGEMFGEFPVVTNWTFQTRWSPCNPNLMATASFDGKIAVNTIQHAVPADETQNEVQNQAIDDEDFFSKAQSPSSTTRFSLASPPKWLQRPCGATFAFGGKVVSFKSPLGDTQRRSAVRISQYAVDDDIIATAKEFESSLKQKDFAGICDSKLAAIRNDVHRHDWQVIKLLVADNIREQLGEYVGFATISNKNDVSSVNNASKESKDDFGANDQHKGRAAADNNRLSAFFDGGGEADNFLSELAATKGAKTNSPFHIYSGSESELDRRVTNALLLGRFDEALDICINEERISDAFMIAICGGQQCIEKAQKAYFKQRDSAPNYLRILASIVGKNLWDLVHNADLDNWREIIATICTYADDKEFQDLCEALGDRLEECIRNDRETETRKNASLCYLAGSKMEKFVAIWLQELKRQESSRIAQGSIGSGFSQHARLLQDFIEKVTVFREVTQYADPDKDASSGWRLASLYDQYIEYADLAAAGGQLEIAERYLDLLPDQYAAADVAKARVRKALSKPAMQPAAHQSVAANRSAQSLAKGAQVNSSANTMAPTQSNQYLPTTVATNPYAPAMTKQYPGQGYGVPGTQQQQQQQQSQQQQQQQQPPPPPQPGMSYTLHHNPSGPGPTGPPVRQPNSNKSANVGNWNDMPDSFFKPPTASRRGTPVASGNAPSQQQQSPMPPAQGLGPPPSKATPALGPPPKVGGVADRPEPPTFQSLPTERPPSAASPYAPTNTNLPVDLQTKISRGPSPYNAPPAAPPSSNRYAPAEHAAPSSMENALMQPASRQPAPPPNPYAPKPANDGGAQASGIHQRQPPSAPPVSRLGGPTPYALAACDELS